ncbi:hypothetical protein ACQKFM_16280 [Paenibacillus xylanexedens]|uniref:hypothetical protein n=1 Tax=Paenibacillus TaxID=44249 RepID=UPI0030F7092C
MNVTFTRKRRVQNQSVEAKRSPKSFLKESYIGSIRYPRIFSIKKGFKKYGDNSDRKMVLQSEWLSVNFTDSPYILWR